MEPVIATLAIIAIVCWALSINWNPQNAPMAENMETEEISGYASPPLDPIPAAAANLGQWDPVKNLSLEEDKAKKNYDDWKRDGDRLWVSQAYLEAIAAYDRALTQKPNASYAWQQRGEALKRLQRYEEAIASYRKALEVSSNPISRYQAWNGLGALLFTIERYEESIFAYKQALILCPNGMGSLYILEMKGIAWSKLNRYQEASDCYDLAYNKAVELSEKQFGQINFLPSKKTVL